MFFIAGSISYIMSKRWVVSRPSIHIFGVRPVVSCSVQRYAIMTFCNISFQLMWFSLTKALNIAVSVLLERSTIASDFGWYGVVLVVIICSNKLVLL